MANSIVSNVEDIVTLFLRLSDCRMHTWFGIVEMFAVDLLIERRLSTNA